MVLYFSIIWIKVIRKKYRTFYARYSAPTFDYAPHPAWGTESDNKIQHSFEMISINKKGIKLGSKIDKKNFQCFYEWS